MEMARAAFGLSPPMGSNMNGNMMRRGKNNWAQTSTQEWKAYDKNMSDVSSQLSLAQTNEFDDALL